MPPCPCHVRRRSPLEAEGRDDGVELGDERGVAVVPGDGADGAVLVSGAAVGGVADGTDASGREDPPGRTGRSSPGATGGDVVPDLSVDGVLPALRSGSGPPDADGLETPSSPAREMRDQPTVEPMTVTASHAASPAAIPRDTLIVFLSEPRSGADPGGRAIVQ